MKRIVYEDIETGSLCVVIPWLGCGLTIDEIATKDVPAGLPYLIVDAETVPEDRSLRNAWVLEAGAMDNPDGYGGVA